MRLTDEQLKSYDETGLIYLPECFSPAELRVMKDELPALFRREAPSRVVEKEGGIVRSVYGSHATNEVFGALTRLPRLVEPIRQLLRSEVYVYQFKINAKVAFDGDKWEWHQDYVFWRKEDGLASPRLANIAIFLDDVNEFNGPMFLIPGSHWEGSLDVPPRHQEFAEGDGRLSAYRGSPAWISNLTATIKYSIDRETVRRLVERYGMVAPKGPAGSVLFFHGNIVHASPSNISPFDRVMIFVTYNSVENVPPAHRNPRPEFLVSRDYEPIVAGADDALLRRASRPATRI